MRKYGFIGAGNMGGALCRAAAKSLETGYVYIADHSIEKAQELAMETNSKVLDNREIAKTCDVLFLGVKPQMMQEMLSQISDILVNRKDELLIVSMAAGLKMEDICKMIGSEMRMIRIMPNTPVSVGEGMILYSPNKLATDLDISDFLQSMKYAGLFDKIEEKMIDAGCALSGCGPAFVFLFMKYMAEGGEKCGLTKEQSLKYAMKTVKGAAALALSSELDLETLKINVCSPGGSTIEGVKILEGSEFRDDIIKAVDASYKKTVELGKK